MTHSVILLPTLLLALFLMQPANCQDVKKARQGGEEIELEIAAGMKMTFCWIPAGKATLGSPESEKNRDEDEPEHEFETKGFWIGKYEVTQEQWQAVMGNNPSAHSKDGSAGRIVKGLDTHKFPVERVSWNDCQEFLKKINQQPGIEKAFGYAGTLKLPHEDQWEYAARGGNGNKQPFYWGNSLNGTEANVLGEYPYSTDKFPNVTVTKGPNLTRTSEVGRYAKKVPHPWGLADMVGNVWEWCDNWYDGPQKEKAFRNGSYSSLPSDCRSASRYRSPPNTRTSNFGFRVIFE